MDRICVSYEISHRAIAMQSPDDWKSMSADQSPGSTFKDGNAFKVLSQASNFYFHFFTAALLLTCFAAARRLVLVWRFPQTGTSAVTVWICGCSCHFLPRFSNITFVFLLSLQGLLGDELECQVGSNWQTPFRVQCLNAPGAVTHLFESHEIAW